MQEDLKSSKLNQKQIKGSLLALIIDGAIQIFVRYLFEDSISNITKAFASLFFHLLPKNMTC